jgi:hypothetical protein
MLAHVCNPSFSEGRDKEDFGSKPAGSRRLVKSDLNKETEWWYIPVISATQEA